VLDIMEGYMDFIVKGTTDIWLHPENSTGTWDLQCQSLNLVTNLFQQNMAIKQQWKNKWQLAACEKLRLSNTDCLMSDCLSLSLFLLAHLHTRTCSHQSQSQVQIQLAVMLFITSTIMIKTKTVPQNIRL
jgi:hypothetical protein